MKWNGEDLAEVMLRRIQDEEQLAEYDIRVLEAETAMSYGISLDYKWFSIDVEARSYMIAGRMGKMWIDSLNEEEQVRRGVTQYGST